MKKFIYYPGFEIQDENWLKFALLYLEELNPIVPYSADDILSDTCRMIQDQTDLIKIHRPTPDEGLVASVNAIDLIEKIIKYPDIYAHLFGSDDFVENWRMPVNWQYAVFKDKYTMNFENFCIENGFAEKSNFGVSVSKQFGYLYMSFLAQSIADTNEISPITDDAILDRLSVLIHQGKRKTKNPLVAAQNTIELMLPANIKEILPREILRLREKPQFKNNLHAFHSTLDGYYNSIENGFSSDEYVRSLGNNVSDMNSLIAENWPIAISFGLHIWSITASQVVTPVDVISVGLHGREVVKNVMVTWKKVKPKRLSRRYLASLTELGR